MPQPTPLPRSVDEKLLLAVHHRDVATLGPEDAAALLLRLGNCLTDRTLAEIERLRAIEQRAREVCESDFWLGEPAGAARYILTGEA